MDKLTVLTRMYGKDADAERFVLDMYKRFAPIKLKFVICTAVGDPVADAANVGFDVKVIYADMKRFDEPVNALLQAAITERFSSPDALFVSPGITVSPNQIVLAAERIHDNGLHWYGWQVEAMLNDGTRPGKLNYNACTLYNGARLWSHAGLVPEYVNNGVLPVLTFDWQGEIKTGPAGGGEETVQMCQVLQAGQVIDEFGNTEPYDAREILFGFDTTVLPSTAKTSTGGIGFDWKIQRKVPMALEYLKRFGMTEEQFTAHVKVY